MAMRLDSIVQIWCTIRMFVGGTDRVVLLVALTAAISIWLFLAIADEVTGQPPGSLDVRIVRGLRSVDDPARPIGPLWFQEAARDATALGGTLIISLVTTAVIIFLLVGRHYSSALLVFIAVAGGGLLSAILKDFYERPRPDFVPHLSHVSSSSFPSAHSMLSAVAYLTLGALLARLVEKWWAKIYFICVAFFVVMLVGMSRAYLGVHYPTDIAAGWAAGVVWANLSWLVARYLQKRGAVDPNAD